MLRVQSDAVLRDDMIETFRRAYESGKPLLMTDSEGRELILMSREAFEKKMLDEEIYWKLHEAELEEQYTDKLYTPEEVYKSAMGIIRGG